AAGVVPGSGSGAGARRLTGKPGRAGSQAMSWTGPDGDADADSLGLTDAASDGPSEADPDGRTDDLGEPVGVELPPQAATRRGRVSRAAASRDIDACDAFGWLIVASSDDRAAARAGRGSSRHSH